MDPPQAPAPEVPDERTQAMVREAATLMGDLFIHRRDRKAIYRPDTRTGVWHWTAIEGPFTIGDFFRHLMKQYCLGAYFLDPTNTVKLLAYDLDLSKSAKYFLIHDLEKIEELEAQEYEFDLDLQEPGDLEYALHREFHPAHRWARMMLLECIRKIDRAVRGELGMQTLTVITGGGAHVLVPLPEPVRADWTRDAGLGALDTINDIKVLNRTFAAYGPYDEISIEIFPKQDSLSDSSGFGNLIRLPFGWHHEAEIRTYSIDPEQVACPTWTFNRVSSLKALQELAQTRAWNSTHGRGSEG